MTDNNKRKAEDAVADLEASPAKQMREGNGRASKELSTEARTLIDAQVADGKVRASACTALTAATLPDRMM
jgi:hypothetical protein